MNKIITLLCVAATFLFVACEPVENESGGLSIYLSLPPALSVDTRAGSIGDVSLSDVWEVQFGADDKKIKAVCYSGDAIKNVKIRMVVRIKHL